MKLFSRFFSKAPPSPPTVAERVAMLSEGSADLILATALGTGAEGLRLTAIQKLPDGDALRRIAGLSAVADGAAVAFPASLEHAAQALIGHQLKALEIDRQRVNARSERRSHCDSR